MKSFNEYAQDKDIKSINESTALMIVEKNIDPEALNELAEIFLEFNPLALAGGLGGAAVGGLPGAMAGGYAGGKAGEKAKNWFKGGQNQKVTPALQKAKKAVANLVNSIGSAEKSGGVQNLDAVKTTATQLNKTLSTMDEPVQKVDQQWTQAQEKVRKEKGGIAQKTQGLGEKIGSNKKTGARSWIGDKFQKAAGAMKNVDALNKQGGVRGAVAGAGDKLAKWAEKNPRLAKAAKLGATGAAMGTAYALGAGGGEEGAGGGEGAGEGKWHDTTPKGDGHYTGDSLVTKGDGHYTGDLNVRYADDPSGGVSPDASRTIDGRVKPLQGGQVQSNADLGISDAEGAEMQQAAADQRDALSKRPGESRIDHLRRTQSPASAKFWNRN